MPVMPTTMKLIFPTTVDRRNPCCCLDQCIRHDQRLLDTVPNTIGYTGTGIITVRDIEYDVNANLSVAGDQIGGNVSFYNRRKRVTVDNALALQRTSFPSIPIFNEWNGLKMNGFGDTGILELSDRTLTKMADDFLGGSGSKNSAIEAVLEATAIRKPFNTIVSTSRKRFPLNGTDPTTWSPLAPKKVALIMPEETTITTVEFEINELTLVVRPSAVQIFGKMTSYTQRDTLGDFPIDAVTKQFSSPSTTSLYNTTFPWSNQWSLIDNLNPSVSLLNPVLMFPYLPTPDLQIVVTIKVTGSQT